LNNAGNAFRAPGAEAEPRRELLRFRAAAARLRIIDYRRAAIIEPANQGCAPASRDVGLFAFSHALLDIAAAVRAPAAQFTISFSTRKGKSWPRRDAQEKPGWFPMTGGEKSLWLSPIKIAPNYRSAPSGRHKPHDRQIHVTRA